MKKLKIWHEDAKEGHTYVRLVCHPQTGDIIVEACNHKGETIHGLCLFDMDKGVILTFPDSDQEEIDMRTDAHGNILAERLQDVYRTPPTIEINMTEIMKKFKDYTENLQKEKPSCH